MLQFTQTVELIDEQRAASKDALLAGITNQQIAEVLFNIATLLEMQQGNPYRIEAYRNAARAITLLPIPVAEIIRRSERPEQPELPGLGKRLRHKVAELVTTGRMTFYNDLCEEALPEDMRSLMTVAHIGPRIALRLSAQLGIHSVAELYEAARDHKLRDHYGFGSRSEQRLEEAALLTLQAKDHEQATSKPSGPHNPQAA